jgi:uncharacterized protein YndB with AHSA1/START domain
MDVDVVTGATVEVVTEVAWTPDQVWGLITAIHRIGDWSPECVGARWLTDEVAPQVGSRFEGVNRFGGGSESTVICEITEADEPRSFAWSVLDDRDDVERPGSRWRYDLSPASTAHHTILRHQFVHGPGATGVSVPAQQQPARAVEIVTARLEELGRNMERTLEAMTGATTFATVRRLGTSVNAAVAR